MFEVGRRLLQSPWFMFTVMKFVHNIDCWSKQWRSRGMIDYQQSRAQPRLDEVRDLQLAGDIDEISCCTARQVFNALES
jgi:hypothetical protein